MMNKRGGEFGWIIVVSVFFLLFWLVAGIVYVPYKTTDNGRHYGQVTAVEDNGLIWKTTTVYFKSDISSSQEDKYCLDKKQPGYDELRKRLESAAKNHTRITIEFYSVLSAGWKRCDGEPAIISGASE